VEQHEREDLMTMRASLFISSLILAALIWAQRSGDFRDPDRRFDEGWTELFNRRDLKDWVVVLKGKDDRPQRFHSERLSEQSTFSVRDGLLVTTGTPHGYIRTNEVFDNFVFHVEVRFPQRGNSGVLIYVQQDAVWPKGIECQLYQSHMGRIFPIQGAYLDGGEMIHEAAKPEGEWNTYQVYSEEGRVATVLNGVVIGIGSNAHPNIGYVCLQSEGAPAEFRNIRIRRHSPAHHLWRKSEPPPGVKTSQP
jgi:nitrogen fixation-related uncharacterized protein